MDDQFLFVDHLFAALIMRQINKEPQPFLSFLQHTGKKTAQDLCVFCISCAAILQPPNWLYEQDIY